MQRVKALVKELLALVDPAIKFKLEEGKKFRGKVRDMKNKVVKEWKLSLSPEQEVLFTLAGVSLKLNAAADIVTVVKQSFGLVVPTPIKPTKLSFFVAKFKAAQFENIEITEWAPDRIDGRVTLRRDGYLPTSFDWWIVETSKGLEFCTEFQETTVVVKSMDEFKNLLSDTDTSDATWVQLQVDNLLFVWEEVPEKIVFYLVPLTDPIVPKLRLIQGVFVNITPGNGGEDMEAVQAWQATDAAKALIRETPIKASITEVILAGFPM